MATKFLEPGGDATFNVATTTAGGFWTSINGSSSVSLETTIKNGSHINSIRSGAPFNNGSLTTAVGTLAAAGSRISFYLYIVTFPSSTNRIATDDNGVFGISLISSGVLRMTTNNGATQIGSDGATLSTGIWYRISLALTITDGTHNRFELFKDGVSTISITNATIVGGPNINNLKIGSIDGASSTDICLSDIYIDNSAALTDPGNIWVTAKRPNANGTTNGFSTQIGAGGSGYGTGHSPQVNERALDTTNGWSMIGAGSAVTEEYNIESKSTGDINISTATIIDWLGWVDIKSLAGETVQIVLDGANTAQAITSTETLYTAIKGSTIYPTGTGADIGVITDTSLTTVSLYECGIIVAYIPSVRIGTIGPFPTHYRGNP
jgi:hypothetical protein